MQLAIRKPIRASIETGEESEEGGNGRRRGKAAAKHVNDKERKTTTAF